MTHPTLPLLLGLGAISIPAIPAVAQVQTQPPTSEFDQTQVPMDVAAEAIVSANPSDSPPANDSVALSFDPPTAASAVKPAVVASRPATVAAPAPAFSSKGGQAGEQLFEGGSDSLVARTVGAAEGTRSPDGGKTSIYEGHTDPGNGVWNRGTFSYQFGNEENLSAEEADRRQVAKIKRIYESVMLSKAEENGLKPLTLLEEINGIDMINQAPLAVTESGGYIERLADAKKTKGLSGREAILDARVWSFWDPQRNGWDAPGLRAYDDISKEASIRHDQQRRMDMIDRALEAYQQQNGAVARQQPAAAKPQKTALTPPPNATDALPKANQRADDIIAFNPG
jgi:hypothetical protein